VNVYKLDSGRYIVATWHEHRGCFTVALPPAERTPGGTHSFSSRSLEECAHHTRKFASASAAQQHITNYLEGNPDE